MDCSTLDDGSKQLKSVLLVDDTPKNLRLLSELLTQNGYIVSSAISGSLALNFLKTNTPDLIMLDIKMPDMDGFEVCRQIKKDPRTRDIPIIFISALEPPMTKSQPSELNAVDYVIKPFKVEEVLARVQTHIKLKEMQLQLKEKNIELEKEIAERKQVESALQSAYDEIEVRVTNRTQELKVANERLTQEIYDRVQAEIRLEKALKKLERHKGRLEDEVVYLQEEIKRTHNFEEIIGNSKKLRNVLTQVNQVATADATVLIVGETGTGKELIVRALHSSSHRSNRPLVKVNCTVLPSNLIESELFGHEKGAFTGAFERKIGRFELADKGTIFLDEIGDLPLDLQPKLLRVLQEGEFERLGSSVTQKVDVRVLAATNRNLTELLSKGHFREDLYFRLSVFPIECPPLRERVDDIPMLVRHFVQKYNAKTKRNVTEIPRNLMKALQSYQWPGNVRELENIIERAVILSTGERLYFDEQNTGRIMSLETPHCLTLDEAQKRHIADTLKITQGRIRGKNGAAQLLGIKPTTLESRMKKLGLKIHRNASDIS